MARKAVAKQQEQKTAQEFTQELLSTFGHLAVEEFVIGENKFRIEKFGPLKGAGVMIKTGELLLGRRDLDLGALFKAGTEGVFYILRQLTEENFIKAKDIYLEQTYYYDEKNELKTVLGYEDEVFDNVFDLFEAIARAFFVNFLYQSLSKTKLFKS